MSGKPKRALSILLLVTFALVSVGIAAAQVSYPQPWFTSYSVANLGSGPADIVVTYYNSSGTSVGTNTFPNVPIGGSVTIQQATETTPSLPSGEFSAVLSSNQPIAAVVNQQLGTLGNGVSVPPFSSYSGASQGSTSVVVPEVMYNWFGHYTELYIQNVGTSAAADIDVTYYPTSIGSCTVGAAGQSDLNQSAAQYATKKVSQVAKTSLGAPSVSGCSAFTGRFLGAAIITSDQPVVVVANHHVQNKLFTYNGFSSSTEASTRILLPAYMKNFFGFYASATIANPDLVNSATVTLTYRSDALYSNPTNTSVVVTHIIPAGRSINRYDGPGTSAAQTDLAGLFGGTSNRFFGSIVIEANRPVVALVNQESTTAAGAKAGAYNGMPSNQGTAKVAVPLIQSAFYGFYTSLTIQTVDGTDAQLKITYTSDAQFSSKLNASKTYTMTTSGGFLNRYEASNAFPEQSDLLDDPFWLSGGNRRFIGSAIVEVISGPNIVAYVNSESTGATAIDRQYTFNAFNITP